MRKKDLKKEKNAKKPASENMDDEGTGRKKLSSRLAFVLVALVAVVFLIYSMSSLIGLRSQLSKLNKELDEIEDEISDWDIAIEDKNQTYKMSEVEFDSFMERIARESLDFIKEGERVFVNVAGD